MPQNHPSPDLKLNDKTDLILRMLALSFFILMGLVILNDHFNWVDDASYILLAKALSTGQGYRDLNLPQMTIHRNFPPGLPVFLTLPTFLANKLNISFYYQVVIFKILLIGCGAASLVAFGHWATLAGYHKRNITWAILLAATSISFVGYTYRVASEMLYTLLTMLTLIAVKKIYDSDKKHFSPLILLAFLLAITTLTRTVGVTLIGAIILNLLLKCEIKRPILIIAILAAMVFPWFIYAKSSGSGVTRYFTDMVLQYQSTNTSATNSPLNALWQQISTNGWLIVDHELPRIIFSISASSFITDKQSLNLLVMPLRLLITLMIFAQILMGLFKSDRTVPLYLSSYLAILLVWPWEPSRFLIPLIPFFCLFFIESFTQLIDKFALKNLATKNLINSNLKYQLTATLMAILVISHLISDLRFIKTVYRTGDFTLEAANVWNDTMDAYQWLKQNSNSSTIIGCAPTVEPHTFLFTNCKAVPLPAQLIQCRKQNLTHIILIKDGPINGNGIGLGETDLQRLIKNAGTKEFLITKYKNNNVTVFEVDQNIVTEILNQG